MGFCCNGFGWGSWMGWGRGWVGLTLNLVFFAGVLVVLGFGAAWLARQLRGRPLAVGGETDPLEIVRQRLAAGEITIEEFEEIRDRLRA
jgi:uncharacterized membrane protein